MSGVVQQSTPPPPFLSTSTTVTASTPPQHLWHFSKNKVVPWYWGGQSANLRYDSVMQNVVVNWAGVMDATTFEQYGKRAKFPLSFYPTDVDILGENVMIVGGKGNTDNAIVEMLYFRWPTGVTSAAPGAPVVLPSHTGSVRSLEVDTVGKRGVRFVLGILGNQPAFHSLVQFEDSRDLYSLNLFDGSHSLVASASTSAGSVGFVPELNDDHLQCWKADHITYGYVYVFGFWDNDEPGDPSTLVFVDSDRDGSPEIHMLIAPGDWATHDLGDESQYIW